MGNFQHLPVIYNKTPWLDNIRVNYAGPHLSLPTYKDYLTWVIEINNNRNNNNKKIKGKIF